MLKKEAKLDTDKKKSSENFIIKNFLESLAYIGENKNFIYFAVFIFFLFILLAVVFPVPQNVENQIRELIKQIFEKTQDKNSFELVIFIFLNNLSASFVGLFFGVIFGAVPFILAFSNGYLLGYVSKLAVSSAGIFSLWRLFPHGIFELPAVLISLGLGFKLGYSLLKSLNKNNFKIIKINLWLSFKTFIFIILPLLLIAAIIEGILISLV